MGLRRLLGRILGRAAQRAAPPPAAGEPALPRSPRGPAEPAVLLDARAIAARLAEPGAVRIVNHWATWCDGCVEELPALARLAEEGRPVVGIGWELFTPFHGRDEVAAWVEGFAADQGARWPTWIVDDEPEALFEALAIEPPVIPQTWVVGADGRVVHRHVGILDAAALAALRDVLRDVEGRSPGGSGLP